MLRLKTWSARGASNHSAFMGKWPTLISLIHSPRGWVILQGNEGVGSVQDFILLYLRLVWIKRNRRQGESNIINTIGGKLLRRPSSSYKKLCERAALWIVYIAWREGYKIVAYNATSVGVGREIHFFVCMCKKLCCYYYCYYQYHCVYCCCDGVKIPKWMGAININMIFQTLCIILSFLFCFDTQC